MLKIVIASFIFSEISNYVMFKKLKEKYNPAYLSGALDIIIIEHPDGTLRSSPWHVRFGSLGLFHHSNKVITISINSETAPFLMYVDPSGRGQFFASQILKPDLLGAQTICFPVSQTKTEESEQITLRPSDIRNILNSNPTEVKDHPLDMTNKMICRNSAVDLDAAFDFDDPDPLPVSSFCSSVDLVQSLDSISLQGDTFEKDNENSIFVPSSILLESIRSLIHEGSNEVIFTVSSLLQGPKTVMTRLFLMKSTEKFFVSDVDGTVTTSDLLGHVIPSWVHPGLQELYQKIINDFHLNILYLSSRPISECGLTRQLLFRNHFPEGPLITCPDLLLPALHREVIKRKPQEFKIPTLQNIVMLFPQNYNPFFFGFGNRPTDVISYNQIGIKDEQILLFNPSHNVLDKNGKVIYQKISDLIPIIDKILHLKDE